MAGRTDKAGKVIVFEYERTKVFFPADCCPHSRTENPRVVVEKELEDHFRPETGSRVEDLAWGTPESIKPYDLVKDNPPEY